MSADADTPSVTWEGKRVLVTGAGGFIGSHLAEALARRGAHVRALVRYNSRNSWGYLEGLEPELAGRVEVLAGDVRDAFFTAGAVEGCDAVFHLAALIAIPYSYVAPQSYVDTNVTGTLNVLEAARRHRTPRLVHISTSETYGTAQYVPIDEAHPLQGQSPYSASKIAADKLAESYYRSFDLPVVTIRPFNTFGPRQSSRAVIPNIVVQALAGGEVRLGSLTPVRDLTFVADTVEGMIRGAEAPGIEGETINLGTGRGISIGELAEQTLRAMGVEATVVQEEQRVRPEKSEVFTLVSDNRAAWERMRWRPAHSLEEGLAATIDWFRTHADRSKAGLYHL